jgi:hypothetical protein
MTRFSKDKDGKYHVAGKTYEELYGTRAQVWHGTSYKTNGGLTKSHLLKNKSGRIVSKAKFLSAKKEKRLIKAGYGTKKGHFGFVKIEKKGKSKKMKGGEVEGHMSSYTEKQGLFGGSRRRRKHKGGVNGFKYDLSPEEISGITKTSGVGVQIEATTH